MDTGAFLTGAGLVAGGLVWLIRLEGRVNTQEALHRTLKDDVNYIRDRIDEALRK